MRQIKFVIAHSAVWLTMACNVAVAQESGELPSAEEIVETYVEARGGEMPLSDVSTLYYKGNIKSVEGSVPWTSFEFFRKGKQWVITYFSEGVEMTIGWDDGKVWRQVAGTEAHWEEQTTDLYRILNNNDPTAVLRWDLSETTVRDAEEVNGRTAWRLDFAGPDGHTVSRFFDTESGLLVKTIYDLASTHMITEYDDFRDVEGLLMHHRESTQYVGQGISFDIELTTVTLNEDMDDAKVAPPDSIADQ